MACIDPHQTGFVGKGSDFQLIKFWPSCIPGKGSAAGGKFFGSALLQPARSVCVSVSTFLLILIAAVDSVMDGRNVGEKRFSTNRQTFLCVILCSRLQWKWHRV